MLALSWQPGFCASDAGADKRECADGGSAGLTLHGLWPNADRNGDGAMNAADDYCYPEDRRAEIIALDRRNWRKLPAVTLPAEQRTALTKIMPGIASGLERHQWVKHGSCSGLNAADYFAAAISLTEDVAVTELGRFVTENQGRQVTRRDLLAAFAAEFGDAQSRALQVLCERDESGAYLTEIRLRLRPGSIGKPLTGRSFDTGRAAKGSCPGQFRID